MEERSKRREEEEISDLSDWGDGVPLVDEKYQRKCGGKADRGYCFMGIEFEDTLDIQVEISQADKLRETRTQRDIKHYLREIS